MFSKFWYHTDWHYFLLPLLNIVWNTKQSELHKYIGLCNTIVRIYKQTNSVRGDKMDFDPIWPVITKLHLALFESLSAFLAAVVSNCVENTHALTDAQCILTQLVWPETLFLKVENFYWNVEKKGGKYFLPKGGK